MSMTTDEQFEFMALIGELNFSLADYPFFIKAVCDPYSHPSVIQEAFNELREKVDSTSKLFEMFEFLVIRFHKDDPKTLGSLFAPYLHSQ